MGKDLIIVEDDILLRENLSELLRLDGFSITECGTAKEFLAHVNTECFKVAIIDIGLPDKSGYDVVKYLRDNTSIGIIILTARTGIDNKIQGFTSGADYFFSKPVDSRELTASINNLLCRLSPAEQVVSNISLQNDSWTLNTNGWLLTAPNGKKISLTTKESDFMRLLQKSEKDGVDKNFVLSMLDYTSQEPYGSRALGVMVTRLRKKIKDNVGDNTLIKTVHGFGFSLGEKLIQF